MKSFMKYFTKALDIPTIGTFRLERCGDKEWNYNVYLDDQQIKNVSGLTIRIAVDELPSVTLETVQHGGIWTK